MLIETPAKEKLIFALDVDSIAKTTPYVEALHLDVGYFKVGLELMISAGAPQIVSHIHRMGGHIFLDTKLCDIPTTVGKAARSISNLGVKMFNVHASCGKESIRAAVENKGSSQLFVVTVLTSMDDAESERIFGTIAQIRCFNLHMTQKKQVPMELSALHKSWSSLLKCLS